MQWSVLETIHFRNCSDKSFKTLYFFFFLISGGENYSFQVQFSCGLCAHIQKTHLILDFLCYLWNLDIKLGFQDTLQTYPGSIATQDFTWCFYNIFLHYVEYRRALVWPISNWILPYLSFPTESYQSLRMTTSCRKKSFLEWITNLQWKPQGSFYNCTLSVVLGINYGGHFIIYPKGWFIMDHFSAAGGIQSPGSSLGAECCPAENQCGVSPA